MSLPQIKTLRLNLRRFAQHDADAFAKMNADPDVMADLGGPLDRPASDAKLERYISAFSEFGYGRWVIENVDSVFLGYAGIMHRPGDHPLGAHDEIGWRLRRDAWGFGYATEAAHAALQDGFERSGLTRVFSYTAADNDRSKAVMRRLGLRREPSLDFSAEYDPGGIWNGLVWIAEEARPNANEPCSKRK